MIDTSNMGRGEEIATIVRNLDLLYERLNGEEYNKLHEKAIHNPSALTKDELIPLLVAELKECLISLDEYVYDDPVEFLINYTEHCKNQTLADMEKLLSQSVADGWNFSPSITPKELLAIYNDLEPQEGEL